MPYPVEKFSWILDLDPEIHKFTRVNLDWIVSHQSSDVQRLHDNHRRFDKRRTSTNLESERDGDSVSSGSDGRDNHVTGAADIDIDIRGRVCRLHKLSPCK